MPRNNKVAAHALLSEGLADAYHKFAYQLDMSSAQVTRLAIVEFLQRRGYYSGKLTPVTTHECTLVRYKRYAKPCHISVRQLSLFDDSQSAQEQGLQKTAARQRRSRLG